MNQPSCISNGLLVASMVLMSASLASAQSGEGETRSCADIFVNDESPARPTDGAVRRRSVLCRRVRRRCRCRNLPALGGVAALLLPVCLASPGALAFAEPYRAGGSTIVTGTG